MTEIHPIKLGFVTCYLLASNNHYILVDAGYPKKEHLLWKFLGAREIDPADIRLIIITHGHVDHVGSLKPIKEKTGASVMIHESEGPLLARGRTPGVNFTKKWLAKIARMENGVDVDAVDPDIAITGETPLNEYGIPGRVIPTPGHTAGSLSVIVDGEHAIIGDIAMKLPLISGGSYKPVVAEDLKQVFGSWQKLLDEGVKTFYPAHGKPFDAALLRQLMHAR